jgi:hypothetical protein
MDIQLAELDDYDTTCRIKERATMKRQGPPLAVTANSACSMLLRVSADFGAFASRAHWSRTTRQ